MSGSRKKFKSPPKRFHPRGVKILYEDHDIVVVDKVSGLLTMSTGADDDITAYNLLTNYVRKGSAKSKNRVFIVHRLDRDTSGIIVFAKSEEAKDYLQEQWSEFTKKYYAVVHGKMEIEEGEISSYLAQSPTFRMYSVSDPKEGKFAKTGYKVLRTSENYSLLEVNLFTGRKNQIRVHLADRSCPVVGDKKYGKKVKGEKRLCLHAGSLTILHPHSKEKMTFETKIPGFFKSVLSNNKADSREADGSP